MNKIPSQNPHFPSSTDEIPASSTFTNIEESFQFSGKLLLREEIPLDDASFTAFLEKNLFTPVPSIETRPRSQCRRCGNRKKQLFGVLPCARCGNSHFYCRNCIEMGRILACEPLYYWSGPAPIWPENADPCSWQGELSRFQRTASDQISEAMIQGNQELLIWAVCGAGKTEMVFQGIAASLQRGKRVCLATPRADVVRELLPRFRSAFSTVAIAGLYGGSEEDATGAQLLLSTTHQLLRFADAFDVLIIDEIDAFPFHNDPSLHYAANRAAKPDAARLYLTATPRKKQQKAIATGKLPAVFVPVRFHGHALPVPRAELIFRLRKNLTQNKLPNAVCNWFVNRKNTGRQLLLFVPTIKLADQLLPILQTYFSDKPNSSVAAVHASDPDREEKISLYRDRKIDVLMTTTILERGVTFPSVDVAVLDAGHTVFDEAALVQIAGRAGRSPDDPTGEVVFFHDGKTDAMQRAISSIIDMNKRGRRK